MNYFYLTDFPRINGEITDSPRIQRAVDACPIGGTLFFPVGQYTIDETIYVWKGITLLGTGTEHNVRAYNHHAQFLIIGEIVAFFFDPYYTPISAVIIGGEKKPFYDVQATFDNMRFRGTTSKSNLQGKQTAIGARKFLNGRVINCHFNALANGIVFHSVWTAMVCNNVFTDIGYGFRSDPDYLEIPGVFEQNVNKYWYQLNQILITNNEMANLSFGIFIRTPGNMITIGNNTIQGCVNAGTFLSEYFGHRENDSNLLDIHEPLETVVVRENYFEANGVHIEVGNVTGTERRGVKNLEVKDNQFNFSAISSHRCMHIHSLINSNIRDNGVRNVGTEKIDIELNPSGEYKNVTVVAELGYGGWFPDTSANVVASVRGFEKQRSFSRLFVSNSNPNSVTGPQITLMNAGTANFPFATLLDMYAFIEYRRRSSSYILNNSENIFVYIEAGLYPEKIKGVSGLHFIYTPSPSAVSGTDDSISFTGVQTFLNQPITIDGRNKIYFRLTDSKEFNPVLIGHNAILRDVKIQYINMNGGNGTKAATVTGGVVNIVNYSVKGTFRPQYGLSVDGGIVVKAGATPSWTIAESHIGSSGGGIV